MTDYATPDSLLKLPLRKFEHFRVTTRDAPPTPLSLHHQQQLLQQHDSTTTSSTFVCQVCQQHVSRYTCPRCQLPYCSVSCYQNHCNTNTTDDNNDGGEYSCTEAFYHDRVQDILQLEQKAKAQDAHTLIRRMYQEQNDDGEIMDNDDEGFEDEELSQLMEVLALLEEASDDDNLMSSEQQLASVLAKSPKLKAAFEQSLERGELQTLVLKPWTPWWMPTLSQQEAQSNHNSVSSEKQEEHDSSNQQTLDERLLNIPSLESLQGGTLKRMPSLTYNLLEVLYRIVWILRLYHGVENATTDGETAVDAALTFLQASTVLSQDARYESLEEVMLGVTAVQQRESTGQHTIAWTILAEDVARLVSNPRLIGRALLEILDIFKIAISYLKKVQQKQQQQQPAEDSNLPDISELRRKRKKLEFFLSWSQHPQATMPNSLADDIRAWIECWKFSGDGQDERELETLVLPSSASRQLPKRASSTSKKSEESPWIQEVQSSSKSGKARSTGPKIEFIE